jgi:hypothetical protein
MPEMLAIDKHRNVFGPFMSNKENEYDPYY